MSKKKRRGNTILICGVVFLTVLISLTAASTMIIHKSILPQGSTGILGRIALCVSTYTSSMITKRKGNDYSLYITIILTVICIITWVFENETRDVTSLLTSELSVLLGCLPAKMTRKGTRRKKTR